MDKPKRVSPLRQLADIISASVTQIDAVFDKAGAEYPSLDAPFDPTSSESERLFMAPEVIHASALAVAACAQLGASVRILALTLSHVASALRVALGTNTVEILRGSPGGLHAKDISKQNGMGPTTITRVLRILATHHVFREVSPNVFTNNRLSSMMDTLKFVEAIKADPVNKHVGTPGIGALKSTSEDPKDAPMMLSFKSSKPSWEWYEGPGNEYRLRRFAVAMEGTSGADPPDAIHLDLPDRSIIVDVGGGLGHTTLNITKEYKHLKFIVQDRPAVIEQAKQASLGRIASCITPQVAQNASVFLCRMICHDYGKTKATQILSCLRQAASPNTKLFLIEQIVPYAYVDSEATARPISGVEQSQPPEPLLGSRI
ncbi:S-adenosyl-L-methionine-dependent methyltransferase [Pleurotus eryngii]|uniref:S-adenosyl-L-methionine-dependent methyltransferase n=1 Tax=Pleurotus eryngii TaxID=5323 RepID=A0A9P6DC22_PLEER|nr:S-adenosyl-L-methionine-dependent methyltransferase [Pleurotus eryngii]